VAICSLQALAGEVVADPRKSQAQGGSDLRLNVCLPVGHVGGIAKYPVIPLLRGASGDEHDWSRLGGAAVTLDAVIQPGLVCPSIGGYAMPDLSLGHPAILRRRHHQPGNLRHVAARDLGRAPQLMRDGKFNPELRKQPNDPSHVGTYSQEHCTCRCGSSAATTTWSAVP